MKNQNLKKMKKKKLYIKFILKKYNIEITYKTTKIIMEELNNEE